VPTSRGLLRGHRDFRLVWTGDTVSAVGDAVTLVALPLVALHELHASTAATAGLAGVGYLPMLLLGLPIGAWVDRLARRPLLLAGNAVAAVAVGSVPLAAALGALTFAQLVVVSFVLGLTQVVTQTAASAFLPEVVPRDRLVEANGALHASTAAAEIGGPSIAGLLVQALTAAGALVLDAASFVAAGLALAAVRTRALSRRPAGRRPRGALLREMAEGLRHVWADPVLRVLVVTATVANLALSAAFALVVPFLSRTLGLAPGLLGVLLGLGSAGGVVGAACAGRLARRFGTGRVVLYGIGGSGPPGLLIPLAAPGPRLTLFVVGLFVLSAGLGLYNVTVVSYRQAATPPELLGRVTAAMRVVQQGVMPLGAALAAGLALAVGTRAALAWSLAIDLVPGVVLLATPLRRLRDLPLGSPTERLLAGQAFDRLQAGSSRIPDSDGRAGLGEPPGPGVR
jgi:MFS family permease